MVHPAKKPIRADSATLLPSGIQTVLVSDAALYGFFVRRIETAVFSRAGSANPSSRPAPRIDSERAGISIPDSQTMEQAPQVVHRERFGKNSLVSDPEGADLKTCARIR